MKDIQNQKDHRCIDIRKVGVKTVTYPIVLSDKARVKQHTVATVNMYVNLPHHFKGTHMSRFLEILNECHGEIDFRSFQTILEKMKERLHAEASHLEMFFPYFMQHDRKSTSSHLSRYLCGFHGSLEQESDIELTVELPVYSAIQKGISVGYWGKVDLKICFNRFYWIEDIISHVESLIACERSDLQKKNKELSADMVSQCLAEYFRTIEEIQSFQVVVHHQCIDYTTFSQIES